MSDVMFLMIRELPAIGKLIALEPIDFLLGNISNLLIGFPGHRPGGLLMSIFLSATLLAACGAGSEAESTYDQVQESGIIRIGVRNDNPPMSFLDESGDWVGFDGDLANAMAKQLALEPELVVVDGTTRISFLQDGDIELFVASMNHMRERDDAIDFSVTYFWDNQSFLVRKGSYNSIDELMGMTVAANVGSSVIPSWQAYSAEMGGPAPDIVEFDDNLAAMQALRDGAVEGYSEDNITLLSLAAGDPNLELLPGGHNPVQFGISVPNNDSSWIDQVNDALQELWKNGTYQEIYERWFVGSEKILDLPLGGEMEIWP